MDRSALRRVAFVDVETTGGHPLWHRITEVAIVTMSDGRIDEEWSALVNPGCSIPRTIQALTGITEHMVADAPTFAEVLPQIRARLAGRAFVAHNARFDYGFLRAEMRRCDESFVAPLICTVRLSRQLYPEAPRHNLDALIERHALACPVRHRALPDARVLAELWQLWHREWPAEALLEAIETISRRPVLPPQLDAALIDELPDAPGVYRFLGSSGALLYIGKAKNLRERVLGHFMNATREGKALRLARQTHGIEWTETAGELGALLLEARLIREHQPVYNRRLRGGASYSWSVPDDGSAPVLVDLSAQGEPEAREQALRGDLFGLYPSERRARNALARIAREHRLCLRVLGLEPGEGSCFGRQVGRCAGACIGAEAAARHGARVKLALLPLKLKSWPWRGPVGLREGDARGISQIHVIDHWQYLGSFVDERGSSAGEAWPELRREALAYRVEPGFDADAYRILSRVLRPGVRHLRPLQLPAAPAPEA